MKIKVIDIMNKIHNEETVPEKIMYDFKTYFYDERTQDYTDYDRTYGLFSDLLDKQCGIFSCLNDEVEIIEDTQRIKCDLPHHTCSLFRFDTLEEKKIPEKLNDFNLTTYSRDDEDLGLELNYTGVSNTFNDVYFKINEIIDYLDYLKSKGE